MNAMTVGLIQRINIYFQTAMSQKRREKWGTHFLTTFPIPTHMRDITRRKNTIFYYFLTLSIEIT